jgi:hypothetical protein
VVLAIVELIFPGRIGDPGLVLVAEWNPIQEMLDFKGLEAEIDG